ncbi:MAG: hypothetical protein CVU17_06440 [Betaproteobacteria bacterium HGW-Betaproteobacteria-11]|nr:MAG: hypothetical protein CVU17_06440 [Betaproteobacteria bacterium HGW-Betaproteobacteria-11]
MISLFSPKADHPLLDAREARRVFAELAAREAPEALEEATAWLESLPGAEGFKLAQRLETVLRLDEAVIRHARQLTQAYLLRGRAGNLDGSRLWLLNHDYWQQLAAVYRDCLERWQGAGKPERETVGANLSLFHARTLHALGMRLRWDQFRYGPISAEFWLDLGTAYLAAVEADSERKGVSLHATAGMADAPTTGEAEYLKVLVFNASAMDQMTPLQIEAAARLIAYFLPHLVLIREVWPTSMYWVDATKPQPPARLGRLPEVTPGLRFFTCTRAVEAVTTLRQAIQAGQPLPASLGAGIDTATVLAVLEHLAMYWSPQPPVRNHVRRPLTSRIAVVHGLAAAHARLTGRADASEVESWAVDDISLGGMRAQAQVGRRDWMHVGALLAIQPEGGDNWLIGITRRYTRTAPNQASVGIETLTKKPRAVNADAEGLATDCLLLDDLVVGETARLALPRTAAGEQVALTFSLDGKQARLFPTEKLETWDDFVIARFLAQSFS